MKLNVLSAVLLAWKSSEVISFGIPGRHRSIHYRVRNGFDVDSSATVVFAKADNDDSSKGMEDAFKQLGDLSSLGDDDSISVPPKKKKAPKGFAKALEKVDLDDIENIDPPSPESEAELYKGMATELDGKTEIDLISDLKSDLGGTSLSIPQFDPTTRDTEKFMEQALDEALKEAEQKAGEIDKESLLDNKEIMKEIEGIFDRANDKLLAGLEEIRTEQMALAKEQAERNAVKSGAKIKEDEARLAVAEENMKKMLARVNEETRNVELAIEDLKRAEEDMGGGVEDQLSSLKSGGIVKQASLVGTLLFSLRATVETVALVGGDSSHMLPALVQGAIAVACFAAFIFL